MKRRGIALIAQFVVTLKRLKLIDNSDTRSLFVGLKKQLTEKGYNLFEDIYETDGSS